MNTIRMISLIVAGMLLPFGASHAATDKNCDRHSELAADAQDLSGLSFRRMNLIERQFVAAHLAATDFSYARVERAQLTDAFLAGSKFFGTKARTASFRRACLNGSDFRKADLRQADFSGASLVGANFSGARLENVVWANTVCPDATKSDENGGTCEGHLNLQESPEVVAYLKR